MKIKDFFELVGKLAVFAPLLGALVVVMYLNSIGFPELLPMVLSKPSFLVGLAVSSLLAAVAFALIFFGYPLYLIYGFTLIKGVKGLVKIKPWVGGVLLVAQLLVPYLWVGFIYYFDLMNNKDYGVLIAFLLLIGIQIILVAVFFLMRMGCRKILSQKTRVFKKSVNGLFMLFCTVSMWYLPLVFIPQTLDLRLLKSLNRDVFEWLVMAVYGLIVFLIVWSGLRYRKPRGDSNKYVLLAFLTIVGIVTVFTDSFLNAATKIIHVRESSNEKAVYVADKDLNQKFAFLNKWSEKKMVGKNLFISGYIVFTADDLKVICPPTLVDKASMHESCVVSKGENLRRVYGLSQPIITNNTVQTTSESAKIKSGF